MGKMIIVGCKLPNGLVMSLQGRSVTLNGSNSSRIEGGYGLTDVDEDFFNEWVKTYAELPAVKKQLIFAQANRREAVAQAKDTKGLKTGLEGIDPKKPGKDIKPMTKDDNDGD